MKGGCILVSVPSGNGEATDLLPVLQPGKGQVVAAGEGQADWQGLWEGCHPWEGRRSPHKQVGNGELERDPRFFDNPPGPRLETLGREEVANAQCSCVPSSFL